MGVFYPLPLRPILLVLVLFLLSSPASMAGGEPRIGDEGLKIRAREAQSFQFAENIGQWRGSTRFSGRSGSSTITFAADGVGFEYLVREGEKEQKYRLSTEFVGAAGSTEILGEEATGARFNYYLGADPSTW